MQRHEVENYSWEVVQNLIEREVSAAFKLREPPKMPSKKEIKQIIKHTIHESRK
jgi:hypothetical protein|tara:strand:- start:297 stop:458 length:162 start_codon:yes stop_codon:yes gene_type:complete